MRHAMLLTAAGLMLVSTRVDAQTGAAAVTRDPEPCAARAVRVQLLRVGDLDFGVVSTTRRSDGTLQLEAILQNQTGTTVTMPVPRAELFELTDAAGHALPLLGQPTVRSVPAGAEIRIPRGARVTILIQSAAPGDEAISATLRLGALGVIQGIPLPPPCAASFSPAAPDDRS